MHNAQKKEKKIEDAEFASVETFNESIQYQSTEKLN